MKKFLCLLLVCWMTLSLVACGEEEKSEKTVECPNCEADCAKNASFCPKCGEPLDDDEETSKDSNQGTTVKCPSCQKACDDDAEFCGKCGAQLISEVVCSSCGKKNDADNSFCSKCGGSLMGGGAQTVDTSAGTEDNNHGGNDTTVDENENETDDPKDTNPNEGIETEDSTVEEKDPSEIWLCVRSTVKQSGASWETTYDYYGRVISEKMLYYSTGDVVASWQTTYDEKGFPATFNNDFMGSKTTGTYVIETVDTPAGEKMAVKSQYNSNNQKIGEVIYTYDDQGRLIEEKVYGSAGQLSERKVYDDETGNHLFTYNASGVKLREFFYNEDGNCYAENAYSSTGELMNTIEITLDHNGNPSRQISTDVETSKQTESTYVYQTLERYRIEHNLVP